MNILIVSNLFGNNRQGYDLAGVLRLRGHRVRLVQFSKTCNEEVGDFGVKFTQPHGFFSRFHVLFNLFRVLKASFFCRKDVVVCIGMQMLLIGAFYKMVQGARLVYYSLEYVQYGWVYAKIVLHMVDRYIDVEENRRERTYADLGLRIPSMIVYNLSSLTEYEPRKGKLRQYLKDNCGAVGDERILIYAGSYQGYACIENLVRASESFADDMLLVLMIAWGMPEDLKGSIAHCKIVPPQSGKEFFDWLSDADCALLPYESESNFNVLNCSPQKLFDCYLVGVPYLASDRPIIKKVLSRFPAAGMICNFLDVKSIVSAARKAIELKSEDCAVQMKTLCRDEFNYGRYADDLERFVCNWESALK